MNRTISLLLIIAIVTGQILKIPLFSQGGLTVLDILITCLTLAGLFKIKKSQISITIPELGVVVFLIIATVSLILTPIKLTHFEFLTSLAYLIRLAIYLLFGWLIIKGIYINFYTKILPTLLVSGVLLAILGLLQFIFIPNLGFLEQFSWDPHLYRAVSTFLDPNFLGLYLTLTLGLLTQTKLPKNILIILFTLVFVTLIITFSRSAYLSFTALFLISSILQKSIKLLLVSICLSAILFVSFWGYQKIIAQPYMVDRSQSAQARVSSWQQGIDIFKKNLLLGVGYNSYRYALREYNLASTSQLTSRGASSNDSSLLHILATTGIVGFLSVCFVCFSILRCLIPHQSKVFAKSIFFPSLMAILVQSFFVNSFFYPFILIWVIMYTAYIFKTSS